MQASRLLACEPRSLDNNVIGTYIIDTFNGCRVPTYTYTQDL